MTRLDAPWMRDPGALRVMGALADGGKRAWFVGGCVRNTLLGAPVGDIDIATDATPAQVSDLAARAGLKPVPTGEDHGTITVVAEGAGYEVTTLRRDVATDGRRAVVAFSTDIAEDARRRDFTMNALYAGPDGTIFDPVGGMADLRARRFRFIGEPQQRIREDFLRILRLFRFHAWYGDPAQGIDPEGLAAAAELADGLEQLSRERVGGELMRLLGAPDPAPSVATMQQAGILSRVLPGADARQLALLVHLEGTAGQGPDAVRRLALIADEDGAGTLRLSRADSRRHALLRDLAGRGSAPAADAYRHGAQAALDASLIRAAMLESPLPADLADKVAEGGNARFPVSAQDLMPAYSGAALGQRLHQLEEAWIASGFTLGREALLALD
ncbi:CCA tRNA nucleotidyltransferase [Brevirhabdus pacifica]|uniref:CCA tRNA nucleotidyltransferase n=1 Tax=Brevirhabdus pacifica TaxID=1267768 RepID=A0A1U7DIU5_9RHOB|nr:CCA tRNA nucleotidyltransferase [Brevirhabdus pacifica]APX89845.1 CCA tRNA nucleotidyltransferase [Brevirhabdus pacifica]PJJ82942.1 poly(A) polymerase/tRNA nucleotidyltransferase (CCA-adding enzyme) [Brevirhabdus pacifica]